MPHANALYLLQKFDTYDIVWFKTKNESFPVTIEGVRYGFNTWEYEVKRAGEETTEWVPETKLTTIHDSNKEMDRLEKRAYGIDNNYFGKS